MNDFLPFIVIGLSTGAVYGLAGMGLVLTYKTSGIFNFGYGAVAALGAFAFYYLHVDQGWAWPLAAVVTLVLITPTVGLGMERLSRDLDRANETLKVVATVGLILVVLSIGQFWHPVNAPTFPHFLPQDITRILGVNITHERIILFVFSAAASGALYWFFRSVRLGIVMRGLVDSHELVSMSGDNPRSVRRAAWLIGTGFAVIAGLLLAPGHAVDGASLTALVFAAFGSAAIGRFGSMPRTFAGGLAIGIAGSLVDKYAGTRPWLGGIPPSVPFIVLFVVLIVTPKNRFGTVRSSRQERVRHHYKAPPRVRLGMAVLMTGVLAAIPSLQGDRLALWTSALIQVILFASLGLLVRQSGQISLAHVTFAAVGASSFSHFAVGSGYPWLVALLLASLVAVPIGALIAIPAVRVSGVFLALATLGFAFVAQYVFYNQDYMFGTSALGLKAPRPEVSLLGWDLASDKGFYYLVLVIVILVLLGLSAISHGRLGRLLEAMADSQLALETRGATTSTLKVIVFCLSAGTAAMAGALTAMLYQFTISTNFPPFESLTLVVLVAIVPLGAPWYAVAGVFGNSIIRGYFEGPNVSSALQMLFGLSALAAVYTLRNSGTPLWLQHFLDRLGGRKPEARSIDAASRPVQIVERPRPVGEGLVVENLSVSFGGNLAVRDVSLVAPFGEITGLIGPNGAGKTTTFNACSGLLRPRSGAVHYGGADVTRESPSRRARRGLGRTFQRPELFTSLTVGQNVAMGCEASIAGHNPLRVFSMSKPSSSIVASVEAALDMTGITDIVDEQVGVLSIGKRRLVELATVLAGPFDLLLLDEPSSGLDALETEQFGRVLQRAVAERGVGILLVEHDMTLVREVCNRVYVLEFGSLIFSGTTHEMHDSEVVRAAYLGEPATTVAAVHTESAAASVGGVQE